MKETDHLLSTTENTKRLMKSINQDKGSAAILLQFAGTLNSQDAKEISVAIEGSCNNIDGDE